MTKAARMMQENMVLVDLVIELADARIPRSSRNPDLLRISKGKKRLLILNKADLADPSVTAMWEKRLSEDDVDVLSLDSRSGSFTGSITDLIDKAFADKRERDRKRGITGRPVRAMIAGIPNVGKSTFINRLAGKNSAKTGNKPGVTRGRQWITINRGLQLLDTPGILWPKFEDEETGRNLALIGSLNDENLDIEELACELLRILIADYPGTTGSMYNIDEPDIPEPSGNDPPAPFLSAEEAFRVLEEIAVSRKLLRSGAQPDTARAARLMIDDFRAGRTGRISLEQ